MKTKTKNIGLTVVEMLVVLVVMAILISLLLPAATKIMDIAKTAKQKAQFTTLEIALESFKNDIGYYPPSDNDYDDYCGAQKLAEAMVGWDLFGFHPKSEWKSAGSLSIGGNYDSGPTSGNLKQRKGPYISLDRINATLLVDKSGTEPGYFTSAQNIESLSWCYVLCDSFKQYNNNLQLKIGTPILYFRAYTNRVKHDGGNQEEQIYEYEDNESLIKSKTPKGDDHQLARNDFYDVDYILDKKITTQDLPYNKDSFILISAGADGLYGTKDYIFNFEKE